MRPLHATRRSLSRMLSGPHAIRCAFSMGRQQQSRYPQWGKQRILEKVFEIAWKLLNGQGSQERVFRFFDLGNATGIFLGDSLTEN